MKIFADKLIAERKAKGWSQHEMAVKLNIPYGTYKNYELTGKENGCQPSLEMLCKIADLLEVSTDYLLGRKDY